MNELISILRVGPIEEASTESRWCYLAVDVSNLVTAPVRAASDLEGVEQLLRALDGDRIVFEPAIEEAARRFGYPVEVPSLEQHEIRADVAIEIANLPGLPATDPPLFRRMFFQGLGALTKSMSWRSLASNGTASAAAKGVVFDNTFDVQFSLALDETPATALVIRFNAFGPDAPMDDPVQLFESGEDIEIRLHRHPRYEVEALENAFGLSLRPEVIGEAGPVSAKWLAENGPALGAGLYALAVMPPGEKESSVEITDPNGIEIACSAALVS